MNFKRRHCKRQIRCSICTPTRVGNSKRAKYAQNNPEDRHKGKSERNRVDPTELDG